MKRSVARPVVIVAVIAVILIIGILAFVYLHQPSAQPQVKPFKIAYLNSGGISTTWNEANVAGLKQAIAAFNSTTRPIILSVDADAPLDPAGMSEVIQGYVQQGYDLIIPSSVQVAPAVVRAAQESPNVLFLECCIPQNVTHNLSTFGWNVWQGYYAAGVLAGLMTKTNVIGFITAFQFDQSVAGYNAFRLGAQSVNPNVKVLYAFTNDWSDPVKGATAAQAMISAGADVLAGMGDGMTDGVIKQAQKSGVYAIGYLYDESSLAPNTVISSVLWNTTLYYYSALKAAFEGNFGYKDWEFGIRDKIVGLAPMAPFVPPDVQNRVNEVLQKIYNGEITIPMITQLPPQP